ncbi:MAG: TetR family transcriptional regulator [Bacillota bacterium]|nr:TetR family transcriptional regulator [Bacillota bacterium]
MVLRGYQFLDSIQTAAGKKEKNGYDKLESMYNSYYKFYRENPERFRLMNGWSHIKNKSEGEGPWKTALILYRNNMFQKITDVIEEGKEDGSIQPETDAQTTSSSIVFLMNGFFDQLSAAGDTLPVDYVHDQEAFSRFSIDLVIKPLKKSRSILATRKGTV